ncbi:hypothetical protein FRC11_013420 [Ceratobasidium sp. 423]|nr:hypothetical protein FRC11_013420 [Ceratobasidium sp. 423]
MNGEEDYPNWSFSIQQAAMDVGIDGHLTNSIPQPDQVNAEDHIDWKEECSALTGGIFSSISGTVLPHLKHLGLGVSPKALWDELKWLYAGTDGNRLSGIWEEIITLSYPDSESFDTWVAKMHERWSSLVDMPFAISDRAFAQCIIMAMPPSFSVPVSILRQISESQRSSARVINSLREHYMAEKKAGHLPTTSSGSVGAFAATQGFSHLRPPPLRYKRTGQKDPDFATDAADQCHACWGKGHKLYSEKCPHYDIRIAAGWQQADHGGSSKKKHKAKDANAAEVKDLDGQFDSIEGNTASIPMS